MEPLSNVGKLHVAVVSGIKLQGAGHVRDASVFHFAIHLNVAGNGFYIDRAMAQVQRRGAFYVLSVQIAAICA